MSIYEERLAIERPEFYEEIKDLVAFMPTFQFRGRKNFRDEQQDNWKMIYDELYTLGRETHLLSKSYLELEHERVLMDALSENDEREMKRILNKKLFNQFIETYPALLWLISNINDSINKLYVGADRINQIKNIHPKDVPKLIPFIQSKESAYIMASKNSSAMLSFDLPLLWRIRDVGKILYGLEVYGADPDDMDVVLDTGHHEIIISYLRKLDRFDIYKILKRIIERGDEKTFYKVYKEFPIKNNKELIIWAAQSPEPKIFHFLLDQEDYLDYIEEITYNIIKFFRPSHLELIMEYYPEELDYGSMIANYASGPWEEEELFKVLYQNEDE